MFFHQSLFYTELIQELYVEKYNVLVMHNFSKKGRRYQLLKISIHVDKYFFYERRMANLKKVYRWLKRLKN